MVVSLLLRFAAGVFCVFTAVLLTGGGAVAVADPDSSGSATAHGNGGNNGSGQHGNATPGRASTAMATPGRPAGNGNTGSGQHGNAGNNASGEHGNGGNTASGQPSTGAETPNEAPGGTDSNNGTLGSGLVAAVPSVVEPAATVAVPGPAPTIDDPSSQRGHASSHCGGAGCRCGGAGCRWRVGCERGGADVVAPAADVVAPAADVVALTADVVTPVPAPVAWVQDMLTLVFGTVVPLSQLQSDLYFFLTGIAGAAPVVEVPGGFAGAGLSAGGHASVASQGPRMAPLAAIRGVAVAGNAARVARVGGRAPSTFGAIEIGRKPSLPRMAPLVPNDAIPMGEQSSFEYAGSDLLLPASQSALAAGVLSGSAGAAILAAAGVLPLSLAALARYRSARRWRASHPYRDRGAHRIPPGQSRLRSAGSGYRGLRPFGGRSVSCRSFGVIGCHPSEGIARRPCRGVKRRTSSG